MEKALLSLTEEQILVERFPIRKIGDQEIKPILNTMVAKDDTDGGNQDDGGGGTIDQDER